jgi:hypothetical protein
MAIFWDSLADLCAGLLSSFVNLTLESWILCGLSLFLNKPPQFLELYIYSFHHLLGLVPGIWRRAHVSLVTGPCDTPSASLLSVYMLAII